MKNCFCLLLLCLAPLAWAGELHKWVDEHGKVHYGDKVPERYRDKAQGVKADLNVIKSELEPGYQPPIYEPDPPVEKKKTKKQELKVAEPKSACAREWQAYQLARACFRKCPKHIGPRGERWYDEDCECENLTMPTCVP